jgi:hypothetical protein
MNTGDKNQMKNWLNVFFNLLTVLVLGATVLLVGLFAFTYYTPNNMFNPYPPYELPPTLALPTSTATLPSLPATWTPEPPQAPSATPAPATPTAVAATPFSEEEEIYTQPTPTEKAGWTYPFTLKSVPSAIDASVLNPERGCNWMGVGGQVLDLQGRPLTGVTVQLGGMLEGRSITLNSLTGTARQYGEAGFEFTLSDLPIASNGTLWVRLADQASLPLSGRQSFDTFAECEKNLIIINFKQIR